MLKAFWTWDPVSGGNCGAFDEPFAYRNNDWFFDTELLILAEKLGYRVKDVAMSWLEDPDTRVKIGSTVAEDLRGLLRLRLRRPWLAAAAAGAETE